MKKWLCIVCGWVYDEAKGWPADGIAAGTRWEDIPEDWLCPDCLVSKADFEMIEIAAEDDVAPIAAVAEVIEVLPVVIVGSGHAGYQLAAALRSQSPELPITVFTADDGALYSKPALSNALALNKDYAGLLKESALSWEQRLNIRVYPHTRVERIDRDVKKLHTSIGEYPYGRLVLATGASPIVIPIQGEQAAVLRVNDLKDYAQFRDQLLGKQHVTILGDGLIGCEFANDLAAHGIQVTVVGLGEWPMQRLIPQPLGDALQQALTQIKVEWKLNNSIESIHAVQGHYRLTLRDGQQLNTDLVLSAVGLRANTQLAQEAGLDVGCGIRTGLDHRSSDAAIFALGDCAEVNGQWSPYIQPINQAIPALVSSLLGNPMSACFKHAPVLVKTPILPLSILVPKTQGQWSVEQHEDEWAACFIDPVGKITGFALLGQKIQQQRNHYLNQIQ